MSVCADPIRICFIGWADHVHMERWAGWFARSGHKVDVLSTSGLGSYPSGVGQHLLNRHGRGEWFARLRLRWLLARLRPQVVHVHWAHFATLAAEKWKGPFVVTAWGSDIYRRDKFSDAEWRALGNALRRADSVTCDSDDLAERLRVLPCPPGVFRWCNGASIRGAFHPALPVAPLSMNSTSVARG